MSLQIASSDISQGQNWCFVFKKVQYRLCHCILLHQIYHKDKTGVVYSIRYNIALCLCISLHLLYHKDKTGAVYQKGAISPYAFAYCCICNIARTKLVLRTQNPKRCSIAVCLCILLHLICHKDKTGVVYSKRCNIVLCLCILLHLIYITRTKNWCCVFKKVPYRPTCMSLHIAASDISQRQTWCCVFKKVQYRLCHCILLHLIYHKDKTGVVYSKRCNIALCLCTSLNLLYHKDKTDVVFSNSKRCSIALCLCILQHLICHKDKTGVVYSKRCNIGLCLCILLHLLYLTTKET